MIVGVTHDDAPIVVNGNVTWMLELPSAASIAADAADVSPVTVPQHLHTTIVSRRQEQQALARTTKRERMCVYMCTRARIQARAHAYAQSPAHTSHLTPHTSYLTPHTSYVKPLTSPEWHVRDQHTSHLTPHTSHITHHTAHLTPHTIQYSLQGMSLPADAQRPA